MAYPEDMGHELRLSSTQNPCLTSPGKRLERIFFNRITQLITIRRTPMNANDKQHRAILQSIAHQAMLDRGLLPDFLPQHSPNLDGFRYLRPIAGEPVRDLRNLLWASIDNDDSLDLDQLTVAEAVPGENIKILVAIADVDSVVKNGSAIDEHAHHNTTSVYTAAEIFQCFLKNFLPTSPP